MKNEMYSDHDSSSAEKPRGTNHVYIHFYNTDRMRFTLLGADTVPANSESSATITQLSEKSPHPLWSLKDENNTRCGELWKAKNPRDVEATRGFRGPDRRRSGDLAIFSRTLYQLSYRTKGVLNFFWEKEPVQPDRLSIPRP